MRAANDDDSAPAGNERDYWLERADHHLGLGEQAADARASWAHFQLAGHYLDRAYGDGAPDLGWERQPAPIRALQ